MAAWEAERAAFATYVAGVKAGTIETKDDGPWLREEGRRLRADGAGHRMALDALAEEDAHRRRRIRLVGAALAERIPPETCPPWARQIFDDAVEP
jgi:hypothetical protein